MKRIETRVLVEAAILAAIASVILILSVYVPFFILVGVIVWPIPITLLTFRHDVKVSVLSLVAVLIIVSLMVDPVTALSTGFLYGIPAIVLGFCLKKKYSPFVTVMATALSMFCAYIIMIKASSIVLGKDVMDEFFKMLDESKNASRDILKGLGISDDQINQQALNQLSTENIKMMLPGLLGITSLVGAYFNYYFVGAIFRRLRIKINELSELKPMDQWYISINLSFGLFMITIGAWILTLVKVPNADVVLNSVSIIFSFIFQVNGLALLGWFLKTRGFSRTIRIIIMAFVLLSGLSMFLLFAGLIDFVFDFRKVNPARRRRIPPGE